VGNANVTDNMVVKFQMLMSHLLMPKRVQAHIAYIETTFITKNMFSVCSSSKSCPARCASDANGVRIWNKNCLPQSCPIIALKYSLSSGLMCYVMAGVTALIKRLLPK
jgi:hypothetical protein